MTAAPAVAVTAARCEGSQLAGRFAVVRGSAGAGQISYRLVLRNVSQRSCTLTGLPRVRLLGRRGKALPTAVRAEFPGALSAVLVTLAPGASARAEARFSPDVNGVGEQTNGPCEPKAYSLRVFAPGGGSAVVPVVPATTVCSRGRLFFSAYGRA
ncbi:MAG TPA: DUF4232 domain-containing protein [Gaiellaceae bacterium]